MDDDYGTPPMSAHPPRFLIHAAVTPGDRISLERDEAHHARVRRLAPGDPVALFDGSGRSYVGTVERATTKEITARIDSELPLQASESPLRVTLAVAMLKSDRFDWMIEKATELGVARIRPFVSMHSLAQPSATRQKRWHGIALSAAKQSGRSVVPEIAPPCALDDMLAHAGPDHLLFWERSTVPATLDSARTQVTVVIGPEGSFSDAEVEQARQVGCIITTLGPRILRAETAAITAVALVQATWGDLSGTVPRPGSGVQGS
jgi:16S rRNA (uracil1498-N3)-methyltransferase